mmetsp:Transcript_573/g.1829  ORF Transcript_573/g.1829 Transcript_573/m.1829 type:complete len:436 (+) Transcript_573:868-2175(+)|eukprot:29242-Pelagococcus_subviridis.AAC.5
MEIVHRAIALFGHADLASARAASQSFVSAYASRYRSIAPESSAAIAGSTRRFHSPRHRRARRRKRDRFEQYARRRKSTGRQTFARKTFSAASSSSPPPLFPPLPSPESPVPPRSSSTSIVVRSIAGGGALPQSHALRKTQSPDRRPITVPWPSLNTIAAMNDRATIPGFASEMVLSIAINSCSATSPRTRKSRTSHALSSSPTKLAKWSKAPARENGFTTLGGCGPNRRAFTSRSKPNPLVFQSSFPPRNASPKSVFSSFASPLEGGARVDALIDSRSVAASVSFFLAFAASSAVTSALIMSRSAQCSAMRNRTRVSSASVVAPPARVDVSHRSAAFSARSVSSGLVGSPIAAAPTSYPATCALKSSSSHTSPKLTAFRTVATSLRTASKYARVTGEDDASRRSKSCMYRHVYIDTARDWPECHVASHARSASKT